MGMLSTTNGSPLTIKGDPAVPVGNGDGIAAPGEPGFGAALPPPRPWGYNDVTLKYATGASSAAGTVTRMITLTGFFMR